MTACFPAGTCKMTKTTFDKSKFGKILKELHLPTIRNIYETAIKEAEKNSIKYEEFLFGLMEQYSGRFCQDNFYPDSRWIFLSKPVLRF